MSTETQCVWIEPNSQSSSSPKGAKTDWFLLVPAREGGGEIAVTIGSSNGSPGGIVLELRGERGDRARAEPSKGSNGRTTWTWQPPSNPQLWRLVVKTSSAGTSLGGPFVIAQRVEPISADERVVLSIGGALYRSKMVRAVQHGGAAAAIQVNGDSRVEYTPGDPRDVLATRFLPLPGGVYRLRLRFPPDADTTRVHVRLQLRDSSWLSTSPAIVSSSAEWVDVTSTFEIEDSGKDVCLHVAADGPATLPDVRLARLERPARIGVGHDDEGRAVERTIADSIRKVAALPDEPRLSVLLATATEDAVERALADDPWLRNYAMNAWEFVHQRTTLTTYPPDICIPIADVCNARCTFCTSWLEGTAVATLEQIDGFEQVIRFSRWVGLAGHGEPLGHPRIREILARLTAWLDRRAEGYVITNGVYLDGLFEELTESRIRSFAISLNAASPAVHREVMGLPEGSFEKILRAVQRVIASRGTHRFRVSVSMVITRQNLHEVAAFVELANELGVDKIQLKTLAPAGGVIEGLNYHTLPPYDHPDYARLKANAVAAIGASAVPVQVDVDSWDVPVYPDEFTTRIHRQPLRIVSREEAVSSASLRQRYHDQPKYQARTAGRLLEDVNDFDGVNPLGRMSPMACRAPYRHLYINDFSFNLSPCCYLPKVPGAEPITYDGAGSFMDAWNSEALVALRRRLRDGPLFNMCTKCPGTY